ncbi:MAG: YbaN family protein, partial [Sphingorhabdus sp.]
MKRPLYLTGGIVSTVLGVVGIFLPIMPTVPFLILAAFCFARSDPALEARILNHPVYG